MRSVGSSVKVGLPDVHLIAAGTVLALAGVDVIGGSCPAIDVSLGEEENVSKVEYKSKAKLTSPLMNFMSWGH